MDKYEHLKNLSKHGVISAVAIDQRGSLKKMLDSDTDDKIIYFKKIISTELTPYASSILLDPEYGLPAANLRADNTGLLLAYEKTGYDVSEPGRMPDLLPNWSAKRIKEFGADAVKFMLYYDVDEGNEINDKKQAFVERIGNECSDENIPFFLELMSYDANITDTKGREYAKLKPRKVNKMIEEFSRDRYKVDVLKVEVPVNMAFVEGYTDDYVYSREEAMNFFKEQDVATNKVPFIFLSAGVSANMFQETLKFAKESGSTFNGVLCGRATWKDGVEVYSKEGKAAAIKWMQTVGKKNINDLNKVLFETATPWESKVKESVLI